MSSWISTILEGTLDTETPEKYHYWSALTAISAVVSPNIFLNRYAYELRPNLFTFLIGESGIKKGPAISVASSLVSLIDCTRVIKGRSSIQGVVKEMSKAYTCANGELLTDSRVFIASSELGSSFVKDDVTPLILMDLYDTQYHDTWKNTLSTVPVSKLERPCVTLLAGSNETNFSESLPSIVVEGGFIARSIIVHETKRRCINSLAFEPPNKIDKIELSKYLVELLKLKGEMTWDSRTRTMYDHWYNSFIANAPADKTGTSNRIGDTILKVGMLISLSNSPELNMSYEGLEEAIDVSLQCLPSVRRVTLANSNGELSHNTKLVLNYLLKKFPDWSFKSNILSSYYGELDTIDLERIIENLNQSFAIDIKVEQKGNKRDQVYRLKDEVYVQYVQYQKKKVEGKST